PLHRDSVQPAVHGASPGSSHAPVHSTHASVHTSAHGSAHGSAHSSAHGSAHGSVHGSAHSSAPPSDGDEENALTYIEKNIASLERTMQRDREVVVDIEPADESRARKLKIAGKKLLRRGFSMGGDKAAVHEPRSSRPTFKSVRSLGWLRRHRGIDSSGDEEQGLLEAAGPSSEPDRPPSQASSDSSEDIPVRNKSPTDTPRMKK
ncbi:uncharacterized protein LOC119192772, partial [Manduca sexta]|uniref:uncharacterized protein LOC119192772 n=1 Tax=Manduca sexta TaxID=7130 RepID=UPI00188EC958